MEAWYIDALDVRAGRAFVTWRVPDLEEGVEVAAVDRSMFFEPPAFQPQPVASRAPAFAASRGSFQLGLYDDKGEVPFEDLQDVAEFIRRAYLSGSSGDDPGPDRGPAPEPPPTEGGAPPPPLLPGLAGGDSRRGIYEESGLVTDAAIWLSDGAKAFYHKAEGLDRGRVSPCLEFTQSSGRPLALEQPASSPVATERLGRAAVHLLIELLRRYPLGGSEDKVLIWLQRAQKLEAAIDRLGLWPWLAMSFGGASAHSELRALMSKLYPQATSQAADLNIERYPLFAFHCLVNGHPSDKDISHLLNYFRFWDTYGLWYGLYPVCIGASFDPVEDLHSIAIPPYLAENLPFASARGSRLNLQALLAAFCSSPQDIVSGINMAVSEARAELLLFATATIVVSCSTLPVFQAWVWQPFHVSRALESAHSRLVADCQLWLADNLPQRVFSMPLEKMIRSACERAYA